MKNHWVVFDDKSDKEAEIKVHHQYRAELQNYLEKVKRTLSRTYAKEYQIFTGKRLVNY